jgi:hypothetical protein
MDKYPLVGKVGGGSPFAEIAKKKLLNLLFVPSQSPSIDTITIARFSIFAIVAISKADYRQNCQPSIANRSQMRYNLTQFV